MTKMAQNVKVNKVAHSGWLSEERFYCLCFIPPVLDNICIMLQCDADVNKMMQTGENEDSFNSLLFPHTAGCG